MVIDNWPLCDPCLDGVQGIQRFGMANSSSFTDANCEPIFIQAPDMPYDGVCIWSCMEMFFVCTKFIPAGGQFLWYYPMVEKVCGVRVNMRLFVFTFCRHPQYKFPQSYLT